MTTKTAPAKPPRERTKAEKTAGRYLAALVAAEIPAAMCRSLPLAILGIRHSYEDTRAARQRATQGGTR